MNEAELMKFLTDHGEHIQMTPDPECSPFWAIDGPSLKALFTGKQLVDAGAVVLSVEDAAGLFDAMTAADKDYWTQYMFDARDNLLAAIEQARGKNGQG